jgi:hypothetical protein
MNQGLDKKHCSERLTKALTRSRTKVELSSFLGMGENYEKKKI